MSKYILSASLSTTKAATATMATTETELKTAALAAMFCFCSAANNNNLHKKYYRDQSKLVKNYLLNLCTYELSFIATTLLYLYIYLQCCSMPCW